MSDEKGMLKAICESPEDDAPRLVYADWCEDNGQPERAEFIRLQMRLAEMGEYDPRRGDLLWREYELLRRFGKKWGKAAAKFTKRIEFRRGFVEGMGLPAAKFLDNADAIFDAVPLTALRPLQVPPRWAEFVGSPQLARLLELDLNRSQLDLGRAQMLAGCEHLAGLRGLNLAANQILTGGVLAVLRSKHLGSLRRLSLSKNEGGDDSLDALSAPDALPHLRELDLSDNHISFEGAGRLARAGWLEQLTRLDLSENRLGDGGVLRLAESGVWAGLKALSLRSCSAGPEGAKAVANCPHLAGLTELAMSPEGRGDLLGEIARSPALRGLRALWLSGYWGAGDEEVDALVRSPLAANLRRLRLRVGTEAGVRTLLRAKSLSGLTHLCLEGHAHAPELARLLGEAGHLNNLTRLELGHCCLRDEGVALLAGCAHLGRLTHLDIRNNQIDAAGLDALAASPHLGRLGRIQIGFVSPLPEPTRQALVERYGEGVCEF